MGSKNEKYSDTDMDDFEKAELEYIYDSLARIQDRRGQIFAFFGTATITTIALAFQEQKAGFLIVSMVFIFLYISSEMTFRAEMAPFYFRGYIIERKHKGLSIIRTYLSVVESHIPLIEYFEKILALPNEKERVKKIQRIFYNPFGPKRGPFILALTGIILELGLLYWLHFIWNWKLF